MEIELPPNLPVGFRFHPTDVEVVTCYLKPKIVGKPFDANAIAEVDLYESEPWELPQKSTIKSKDRVWWFLCRKDYKYPNSRRAKRSTRTGFWKITGQERKIKDDDTKVCIGRKRTLVFHSGPAPGKRTNWVMQEIYLDPHTFTIPPHMASYVICKLKMKSDDSVDTPGAEIASVQTVNGNTELNRESPFEATDVQDCQLTKEDIVRLLASFDADSSEESPEEFANGLIGGPGEGCDNYYDEPILVGCGDSSANASSKRLYFGDAPGGSDTEAEGATGWTMEGSGSFDSRVRSKKVRQMRMSKTPSKTLQASVSSRHFVQERAVALGSVSLPKKDSSSNANRPEGPVLNTCSVTLPQSPDRAVLTGGNRQKEVYVKEPGDDGKAVEKGRAERRLKPGSCGSKASKWRSVFTLVDASSLSMQQSRSPSEYWLNLVAGTVLFVVFVRELVVFGSWG